MNQDVKASKKRNSSHIFGPVSENIEDIILGTLQGVSPKCHANENSEEDDCSAMPDLVSGPRQAMLESSDPH